MKSINFYAVGAQQVTTHASKLIKLEATQNSGNAAGLYFQFFDNNIAPIAGAVPLKSWPAAEVGYKEFELGELVFSLGIYAALSTTAATYTAAAGATLDILEVELTDPEYPTGTSYAGDLVTNVQSLQVWSDAAGPKKLIALEVDGSALSGPAFIMLFATDNPANGAVPIDQFSIAQGAVLTGTKKLFFGSKPGREVLSANSTGAHDGCTVAISTTAGKLTLTADNLKIKAEYI